MTPPEDTSYLWLQSGCRSIILTLTLAMTACYPQLGDVTPDDPQRLLSSAKAACLRQDTLGARTLSQQLVTQHPAAPQATHARAYLATPDRCDPLDQPAAP